MSRVKEVMDVWFDSGAMPFAQDHYPFDTPRKGLFRKEVLSYPADFISEAIDQTRGWFYTLHAVGILLGKGKAFKNVICLGHILDGEGKKMSKSVGNVVDPWSMMDKYGADALRFWMYSVNQPGDSKNFEEKTVDEIVKKVFNLAGNALTFYLMYGDKSEVEGKKLKAESQNVLDKWITARMDEVIETVTKGMDAYVFQEPTRVIRDFIADLSQWYLRRSRDRFKGADVADKEAAIFTMQYILITLAKVMAPFTPFFADYLYQNAGGRLESVHLEEWPQAGKVDLELIEAMKVVRDLASKGLEARMTAKINVRQPLASLKVKEMFLASNGNQKSKMSQQALQRFTQLIKDEVNVKEVIFGAAIQTDVLLDLNITPELKEEGMVRELVRAVQDLRKEKGLSVSDLAALTVETNTDGQNFIQRNKTQLSAVCSVSDVKFGSVVGEGVTIGDLIVKLSIEK
jgi:isoleucyl-tRNA synthetase